MHLGSSQYLAMCLHTYVILQVLRQGGKETINLVIARAVRQSKETSVQRLEDICRDGLAVGPCIIRNVCKFPAFQGSECPWPLGRVVAYLQADPASPAGADSWDQWPQRCRRQVVADNGLRCGPMKPGSGSRWASAAPRVGCLASSAFSGSMSVSFFSSVRLSSHQRCRSLLPARLRLGDWIHAAFSPHDFPPSSTFGASPTPESDSRLPQPQSSRRKLWPP
ncbi:hypothetical protein BT67DRAFT_113051 [Trichocladium antarcticum]|uniref:Uncharacterized protein n=1 Tax=Trichocladium antarcticum TaxID=1450529 RepID=A0AAN6ZFS4_9PEZI|nr:hypothetical protein BT67DRAFT_113051 [Trichocladium antarcticum]